MPVPQRVPMTHKLVFPEGAYVTSAPEPEKEYDRDNPNPDQKKCPETELPLWKVIVTDAAAAKAKDKTVTVKIASKTEPQLPPPLPGTPFHLVEFVGLEGLAYPQIAYFDGKARAVQCWSFRAEAMKEPASQPVASSAKSSRSAKAEAAA